MDASINAQPTEPPVQPPLQGSVQPARKTFKDRWGSLQQAMGNRSAQLVASIKDGWAVIFPARVEDDERSTGGFFSVVLQIVLWLAFGAFLFASLPHVAYFFATFEPQDNGGVNDYWWFVSYMLAVAIDVTAFLLSLNVAVKMRRATRGLPWYQKIIPAFIVFLTHWPFILLLVGFSWLVNFEHAKQFHSQMLSIAEDVNINLVFWQGKLGDLNPVIASAFPVLAVAYTGMSDQIGDDRKRAKVMPVTGSTPVATTVDQASQETTTNTSDLEKLLTAMQSMNQQNLQAMQAMNQQALKITVEQFTRVTVEAVREAVGQVVEALPYTTTGQIESPHADPSITATLNGKPSSDAVNPAESFVAGLQHNRSPYAEQIEALYKANPKIEVSEVVTITGCSRPVATKWLGRMRPLTDADMADESLAVNVSEEK